jgi:hypothetical protein
MPPRARDHFKFVVGIIVNPANHRRHFLPAFCDDRINQLCTRFG